MRFREAGTRSKFNISETKREPFPNSAAAEYGHQETEEVLQMKKRFTAEVVAGIAKTILAMLHVQKSNA